MPSALLGPPYRNSDQAPLRARLPAAAAASTRSRTGRLRCSGVASNQDGRHTEALEQARHVTGFEQDAVEDLDRAPTTVAPDRVDAVPTSCWSMR